MSGERIGSPVSNARLRELGKLLGEGLHLPTRSSKGYASTLSLDDVSLLRGVHCYPMRPLFGAGTYSLYDATKLSTRQHADDLHQSWRLAFDEARQMMLKQAKDVQALGVTGIQVASAFEGSHINVVLSGNAIESAWIEGKQVFPINYREPFLSDLSVLDFVKLTHAGWYPLSLACGAHFVSVNRRDIATAVKQHSQNIELTAATEGLREARAGAMQELQTELWQSGATGVVGVKVDEAEMYGPIWRFIACGTTVWQGVEAKHPEIHYVLPVDD